MPENIFEKAVEILKQRISELYVGLIGTALCVVFYNLLGAFSPLYQLFLGNLQKSQLMLLLIFLLLIIILIIPYLFYLRKQLKPKFISKFGVLWDNIYNPLCPKCDNILTDYVRKSDDPNSSESHFHCHKCNEKIFLFDEYDKVIDFKDAHKEVKMG